MLQPGARVWAPHPDYAWAAAVVDSVDAAQGTAHVLFAANDVLNIPAARLVPLDERDPELGGADGGSAAADVGDLIALPHLHEAAMLNVGCTPPISVPYSAHARTGFAAPLPHARRVRPAAVHGRRAHPRRDEPAPARPGAVRGAPPARAPASALTENTE